MQDKEITINVSVAEANGIIQALGQMPYMQAETQLNETTKEQ